MSHTRLLKATLRATLSTPLSDGTEYVSVSDTLTLRVSDEYIDVNTLVNGASTGTVDITLDSPVELSMIPTSITGAILEDDFPYTLDIYNSFDDSLIETGIVIPTKKYTLSFTYSKKIGSYKFVVRDRFGRT